MAVNSNDQWVLLEDETLRDGLQVESRIFSLEEKLALYRNLRDAGVRRIQIGSFVNPKRVPQMADTEELIARIAEKPAELPLLSALILNEKGLERALDTGVGHVSMSVSASNTHSIKNAGKPAAEALSGMLPLIKQATTSGLTVRAGLQCAFGCVYEGAVPVARVLRAYEQLAQAGAQEINLADTTGMASPAAVTAMIEQVQRIVPDVALSLHVHDTRGLGLANIYAAYQAGARTFDVCTGGLGGCPFVRGAAGNVATEDAVNMFNLMGVTTGIDIGKICAIVSDLENVLGRSLPGRMKTVLNAEKNNA